ncbi:MAG: redoxin family protein, partial [Verrucomicrobia bacterium]|nr:redoxin family protein [Verrucomicrobiota bacterium]
MSEVLSTFQLQAGDRAPDFTLADGAGLSHSLAELTNGKTATVIIFACNHCPFVIHLAEAVAKFAGDYAARGVQVIAINSNDVANYPADSPEKMVVFADQYGWDFPYLYDESQEVAQA